MKKKPSNTEYEPRPATAPPKQSLKIKKSMAVPKPSLGIKKQQTTV